MTSLILWIPNVFISAIMDSFHLFSPVVSATESIEPSELPRELAACVGAEKHPVLWWHAVSCLVVTAELG